MCGFDIRCAAEQETEVNSKGSHLLIIWDIVTERAPPVAHRTEFYSARKQNIILGFMAHKT